MQRLVLWDHGKADVEWLVTPWPVNRSQKEQNSKVNPELACLDAGWVT
jgi:hypothetical protein